MRVSNRDGSLQQSYRAAVVLFAAMILAGFAALLSMGAGGSLIPFSFATTHEDFPRVLCEDDVLQYRSQVRVDINKVPVYVVVNRQWRNLDTGQFWPVTLSEIEENSFGIMYTWSRSVDAVVSVPIPDEVAAMGPGHYAMQTIATAPPYRQAGYFIEFELIPC